MAYRNILHLIISIVGLFSPAMLKAQMNISGKPGLIYIPSAELLEDGSFTIGYNYNPIHYAFRFNPTVNVNRAGNSESIAFINLALLPRFEININLLNPNGPINFKDKGIGDRQIDLKYVFLTEHKHRPSMAIILSAPFGIDNSLITNAIVASKHIDLSKSIEAVLTVGIGSPYSIYRADVDNKQDFNIFSGYTLIDKRDKAYYYLVGPFGGVKVGAKKGGLILEWDSQHLNVGVYGILFKHWTVQAGLLNGDQFSLSTSYTMNLLQLPKRLRKHEKG